MKTRTFFDTAKLGAIMLLELISVNAVATRGFAQRQAVRIQLLTTLPVHAGYESFAATKQYPNKGTLEIPKGMQIEPPFAWNRDDKYVAPDFEAFFPDDPDGGKQLDALFSGRLGGHHAPEDVLAAVRRGLRHTKLYTSQLVAGVGSFVWGAKEQDPRAIELLYHASDVRGPVAHDAMYYGLTVLKDRTPNALRALVEGYASYSGDIQGRIPWGFNTYGDKQQTASLLADLLGQPEVLNDNAVVAALDLYREAAGEPYPNRETVADRGRFVVGFTHDAARTEKELRECLEGWIDNSAVEAFVVRIADGQAVGVGLIKGVGNREKLALQLRNEPTAAMLFAETFAPVVLQQRQLREFASFLPDGLPEYACPTYAPVPSDERFAWNATDGFQPPNFVAYFPDDAAGGLALDELYEQRDTSELTAREQLNVVRQGLRRAKRAPQLSSWVASISGWPDDPMAKEIFYQAADPQGDQDLRYYAIYFGVSGFAKKTPNVLRLFSEIILSEPDDGNLGNQAVGRVVWSLRDKDEKATVAGYLDQALQQHEQYSPEKLWQVAKIYEGLTGNRPSTYDKYADRGSYFVAFKHRELKSVADLTKFCAATFEGQPFYEKSVVGASGELQGTAVVIVRGPRGVEQCAQLLKTVEAASIQSAGLTSLLDKWSAWQDAVNGSVEPESAVLVKSFRELYETLGREYAHFEVKEIDWEAVGEEMLPRSEKLKTRAEFCRLCQELVARLEDSHAYLFKGTVGPEAIAAPRWDPGFACLFDAQDRPIVYHVDAESPAAQAGLRVGMIVTRLNDRTVKDVIADQMRAITKYAGYSSTRYLRYHAGQWLGRQMQRDALVRLAAVDVEGHEREFEMQANLDVRYLPRLPVPIDGIRDAASVSWKRLDDETGYIYVRKISGNLPEQLDSAVAELQDCKGLIIDVRGNSGGGFDAARAFRNFDLEDKAEPERPRFSGRIAVLIDARCISAGEGWASWFKANGRAKFFGETTAGASSRKSTIDVLDGAYKVIFSVKAYRGFLDRPIERRGIEPDIEVHQTAEGLSKQTDSVLTAAREWLTEA